MRPSPRVWRWTILVHRWLGVVLSLFFLTWFLSGMVMVYVPFPRLTLEERLAGAAPLDLGECCIAPRAAADAAGVTPLSQAKLAMHEGVPVYRLLGGAPLRWVSVGARYGMPLPAVDAAAAERIAARFSGVPTARALELLHDDQWSVSAALEPWRPLHKVRLDDAAGTELYVSATSGEVVRDTTRSERFWNWLGAVPHWIYPTVLRRDHHLWHHTVVWLSIAGIVMTIAGSALGIWRLRMRGHRISPYREAWMRWHHLLGLFAMLFVLTWISSGLLSMNPFKVFPSRAAPVDAFEQRQRAFEAPDWAALRAGSAGVREVQFAQAGGIPHLLLRGSGAQVRVFAAGEVRPELAPGLLAQVVAALRPGVSHAVQRLEAYDDHYYPRLHGSAERPLPVLRADFSDGATFYVDPAGAAVLLRVEPAHRWQRWLFNGLHSFDWQPVRERPRLRETLILAFATLGAALCVTGLWLGVRSLRRLRPNSRRRSPRARETDAL
jgi:hypothetical protein